MKTPPATPEFARFAQALSDVLKVSPREMQTRTAAKKQSGKRLSKSSASLDPASSAILRDAFADR